MAGSLRASGSGQRESPRGAVGLRSVKLCRARLGCRPVRCVSWRDRLSLQSVDRARCGLQQRFASPCVARFRGGAAPARLRLPKRCASCTVCLTNRSSGRRFATAKQGDKSLPCFAFAARLRLTQALGGRSISGWSVAPRGFCLVAAVGLASLCALPACAGGFVGRGKSFAGCARIGFSAQAWHSGARFLAWRCIARTARFTARRPNVQGAVAAPEPERYRSVGQQGEVAAV